MGWLSKVIGILRAPSVLVKHSHVLAHHNLLQKPNEKEICYIAYTFDNGTLINLSRVDGFKQKSWIFVAFLRTVVVVPEDSMTCFLIIVCWKIP